MLSESPEQAPASAAARLVQTVRRSFRAFARAADRLHADLGVTAAMRVVLELLDEHGPMTVPQMARARGLTRQHFQAKVDALLARGLVEALPNPAHARSMLIAPTARGRQLFAEMRRREAVVFGRATAGLDAAQIEAARRMIETLVARVDAAMGAMENSEGEKERTDATG